jgi:hypothetical protein
MVEAVDLEDIRAEPVAPERFAVTLQQSGRGRSRRAAAAAGEDDTIGGLGAGGCTHMGWGWACFGGRVGSLTSHPAVASDGIPQ